MLSSMRSMMNLSATVKTCTGRDGTGKKTFSTSSKIECYAEGKVETVTNAQGKEIVSMKHLFVPGDCVIAELDSVIFEGKETEVKAISYFYRNGVPDIKVVYL